MRTEARGDPRLSLEDSTIHLWVLTFAELRKRLGLFDALLTDDEHARAERFHFHEDRLRFVLTRGQLRELLESYTGTPAAAVRLAYGPHGRPSLRREAGCLGVRFSVAHTHTAVAYAFALHRNVGVDLEPLVAPDDDLGRPEVYRRMLSPAEARLVEETALGDRARLVLTAWVRKEAALKALGAGFAIPPDQVGVLPGQVGSLHADGLANHPTPDCPSIRVEDFTASGHLGAVAVTSTHPPRIVQLSSAEVDGHRVPVGGSPLGELRGCVEGGGPAVFDHEDPVAEVEGGHAMRNDPTWLRSVPQRNRPSDHHPSSTRCNPKSPSDRPTPV